MIKFFFIKASLIFDNCKIYDCKSGDNKSQYDFINNKFDIFYDKIK